MITPKEIFLVEDYEDGEVCMVWCYTPAPTHEHNPDDAIKYIHTDEVDSKLHQAALFHALEINELQDRFKRLVALSEDLLRSLDGDVADVEKSKASLVKFIEVYRS